MAEYSYAPKLPSPQAFKRLRDSEGWGQITLDQAKTALSESLGGACLIHQGNVIGMARYVGDAVLNIYIQDVVISKAHRGRGLGKQLLDFLFTQLQSQYAANCTIGLMAAKGQDSFYAQFGFTARPSNVYGAGMIAPLGNIRLK